MFKLGLALLILSNVSLAFAARPKVYTSLLRYVQKGPDQGETNTCWFVASTGAMELLMNKKDNIRNPKVNGKNDLSESFTIYAEDFVDQSTRNQSWLETIVLRFNNGEAVRNSVWPFVAYNEDGTDSQRAWWKHPDFLTLPRVKTPQVKTELLFSYGNRWATEVLEEKDLELMKETMSKRGAPLIVNYNDDGYWHVVLIVGYDDRKKGTCYELEKEECKGKGAFYVRDSDGKKYEARDYSWFLQKGSAAAVVELKK
jgi:C1A family cysteine protease